MALIRSRLGFVVASLAVTFICWAVVYLPPYEKIVYENSPILSQEEANEIISEGYRGAEDIDRVHSIEEFYNKNRTGFRNVVLEIDTKKLKATGIYQSIEGIYDYGNIEDIKIKVFLKRTIKSYGQYYVATLDGGEQFMVFIDDSLINMKIEDVVELPIGRINITNLDFEEYGVAHKHRNRFLDCASGFATGPEMQDFRFMEKMAVLGIIVVMVVFLGIVLGINIGNSRK